MNRTVTLGIIDKEKEAQSVINPSMEYVGVCTDNEEDAQKSHEFESGSADIEVTEPEEDGCVILAKFLKKEYNFEKIAIHLLESFSASMNGWSALLHDEIDCRFPQRSHRYEINIIDRIGGGDSFASGLMYRLLIKTNTKQAIEFAVSAPCMKQTNPRDFNLVQAEKVDKQMQNGGSGRVER